MDDHLNYNRVTQLIIYSEANEISFRSKFTKPLLVQQQLSARQVTKSSTMCSRNENQSECDIYHSGIQINLNHFKTTKNTEKRNYIPPSLSRILSPEAEGNSSSFVAKIFISPFKYAITV